MHLSQYVNKGTSLWLKLNYRQRYNSRQGIIHIKWYVNVGQHPLPDGLIQDITISFINGSCCHVTCPYFMVDNSSITHPFILNSGYLDTHTHIHSH